MSKELLSDVVVDTVEYCGLFGGVLMIHLTDIRLVEQILISFVILIIAIIKLVLDIKRYRNEKQNKNNVIN